MAWLETTRARLPAPVPRMLARPLVIQAPKRAQNPARSSGQNIEQLGPQLWAQIHRRPWAAELAQEPAWLATEITPKLASCACRKDWLETLQSMPPDTTSREAYFAWTVAMHNRVNARLGKPLLSLDQARAIWHPAGPLPAPCTPHETAPQGT